MHTIINTFTEKYHTSNNKVNIRFEKVKNIDTKQSNKKNNQNSKDKTIT